MAPEPLARHPIGRRRAALTIGANLLLLLIGSGTLYGYNALRPVLVDDGAYKERCAEGNSCQEQKLALNLVETLSFIFSDIMYLPCGLLMDYIGIRSLSWILLVFYLIGFGTMALASATKIGVLYMASLLILGGAPSCTYLTGLGSAKMLWSPRYTHFVSAGVSLCYEVSPMFLYLLRISVPEYLSLQTTMTAMAILTSSLCAYMGFSHMTVKEAQQIDESHGLVKAENDSAELWEHLLHPRYLLHALFVIVVNTKNQFYVATFADQIDYFSSQEESELSNYLFDVGFFVSPIFATPFVIVFLDRNRDRYDLVFFCLWAMTMCHALLNAFGKESLLLQLAAMVIFWILKPLKWAAAAEFLHRAPYKLSMYGRLFGVVSIACALGSAFVYPLTAMSFQFFDGSFFEANIILTLVEGSVVVFPIYLYWERQQKPKIEGELKETMSLLAHED